MLPYIYIISISTSNIDNLYSLSYGNTNTHTLIGSVNDIFNNYLTYLLAAKLSFLYPFSYIIFI